MVVGGIVLTWCARVCVLVSKTSADPRFYFTVATNKKDPDDGDQALLTSPLRATHLLEIDPKQRKSILNGAFAWAEQVRH